MKTSFSVHRIQQGIYNVWIDIFSKGSRTWLVVSIKYLQINSVMPKEGFISAFHWGTWIAKMVSLLALNIGTLHHALGCELKPQWRQTLFWTQAQHLYFVHDSIWFIWFDTIIWLSNLSCEFWNRKLKINEIYFIKIFAFYEKSKETKYEIKSRQGSHWVVWENSNL